MKVTYREAVIGCHSNVLCLEKERGKKPEVTVNILVFHSVLDFVGVGYGPQ